MKVSRIFIIQQMNREQDWSCDGKRIFASKHLMEQVYDSTDKFKGVYR